MLPSWLDDQVELLARTAPHDPEALPDGTLSKSTMRRPAATAEED
jgi:hypothetical protein